MATTLSPLSLTILRQGERLFVDLAEVGTLIPRGEIQVEDAFLREVAEELRLLATPGFGPGAAREGLATGRVPPPAPGMRRTALERLGGLLFSHLFPEPARVRLRAAAPGDLYLRLDEPLLALPWELAYDGQDFLATKFCVGRQVITSHPLPGITRAPVSTRPLKVLLVADPTETLPQAAAEVERLCTMLEDLPGVEVTLLGGRNLRKLALLAAVQEHGVVHFAGHSVYDPRSPGESGWRLHEGLLTARELGTLTHPPRLVFSNSCQAAATTGWGNNPQDRVQGFGVGSTFLLAGVPNYIGPCWVVDDAESVEFALAFYRQVATGAGVGTALRHARQASAGEQHTATLTWASYVLYGNPTAILLTDDTRLEGQKPSSLEQRTKQDIPRQRTPRRKRTATTSPRRVSQPVVTAPTDPAPTPPDAERRQLTVLFCDLVDFTALSTRLDPEELREVVQTYHETCATVIQRYDGHIAQYLGDGLLVYFGYPVAHEDAAARAVRAGLGIVEAMQSLSLKLADPLRVRVGIHTGLVVVGEIGSGARREQLAVGEAPNMAARLQGVAAPNTVVMSEATARLVTGLFIRQSLGPHSLKGLPAAVEVYQVLKESEDRNRFAVAVKRGLTPLVGRETELGLLRERWAQARDGRGQVVLLSGEPGIGKSRLVQELSIHIAPESHSRLEFNCSPYYQHTALHPMIDLLQRVLQFTREDTPEGRITKLEGALTSLGFVLPDVISLFAALLSLPLPERYPPLVLTPQKQREQTQHAIVAWLLKVAERQPLLLVGEDLQWADPSSLELLSFLVDQAPTAQLFLLLTARPEFSPPWGPRAHLMSLMLNRLPHTQAQVMVGKVTGSRSLPSELLRQIVAKTDGVPLFVEELTKMVLESGFVRQTDSDYELTGPLPALAIPATLQDSLMARLDRLATGKAVAQIGATLGREFSYEILQAISPIEEARLQQALTTLVEAEVLYQRGLTPQTRYLFKHALIQDAAYHSLLKSERQHYHNQIAHVLEERFAETKATQPELLAHHYTEAGLIAQAIPYWQQAGQKAFDRGAAVEAISQLNRGVELLTALPDTPERAQQELALQLALGLALMFTKGFSAPEVERAYARARELCPQVGETPQLFWALWGLWQFYETRGEYRISLELAEQLLPLAQGQQDPVPLIEAYHALGENLYLMGELTLARSYLEQGITLYDPQQRHILGPQAKPFLNAVISCQAFAALVQWLLGYPDQALKTIYEAHPLVQEMAVPIAHAGVSLLTAFVHRARQEVQAARDKAEVTIALAMEHGNPLYYAEGTFVRGWALTEQGQIQEGLEQMRHGIAVFRAAGAAIGLSDHMAALVEPSLKMGQTEEASTALAEAFAIVDKNGERMVEAGLYWLKGVLALQSQVQGSQPNIEEAEAGFLKAIDIARRQRAKSLELRAVMSLSRLWQQQGKKTEAHQMLSEIYNWFTEGFDTKDLQEAKTLLEELA